MGTIYELFLPLMGIWLHAAEMDVKNFEEA